MWGSCGGALGPCWPWLQAPACPCDFVGCSSAERVLCCAGGCRCRMELIKPAVDWRKAGVKVNTMGAAVAK